MIKLSEVIDTLYEVDINNSCYFNTKTNEILWYFGDNEENSTYKEDEYNDDIINMFNFFSKNDYYIMQDFIETIKDDKVRYKLYNATRGRGSFHRFRSIIDSIGITDDWYKFRDNVYKDIALEWCKDNNIEYEKDC